MRGRAVKIAPAAADPLGMSSAHRWSWSRRAQPGQRHVRRLPTMRTGAVAIVVEGDDHRCTVHGSAMWRTFSNAYDEWEDRLEAMAAVETVVGTPLQWAQLGPHTWAASPVGAGPVVATPAGTGRSEVLSTGR